jgi:hypothetical protein
MTGKKIVTDWLESRHGCFYGRHEVVGEPCLVDAIDAALAAGCPECADAAEWHAAIMAETCGEDEHHCACVPILRARIKELNAALEVT